MWYNKTMIDYKNFEEYKDTVTTPQWAIHQDNTLEFIFPADDGHEFQKFIQVIQSDRMHIFNIYWDGQFDECEQMPLTLDLIRDELGEILTTLPTEPTYAALRSIMESM